jgi:hypothetical protein
MKHWAGFSDILLKEKSLNVKNIMKLIRNTKESFEENDTKLLIKNLLEKLK